MAVIFKTPKPSMFNPAQAAAPAEKKPAQSATITETKKQQKARERLERKVEFFRQRKLIDAELEEELRGRDIPETVAEGIKCGRISAQEILELYEEETGEQAGPRLRKYIVASVIAKDRFNGKAPGANNYSPEVADLVIERMLEGESLSSICRDKFMPFISKFLYWVQHDESLRERYMLAQQIRTEAMAHELLNLSDNVRVGVDILQKADGSTEIKTGDMINRTRMQIDTRKFLLSKLIPQVYGQPKEGGGGAAGNNNGGYDQDQSADGSGGSKQYFTVTGGLPDIPLGTLNSEQEKDEAIAQAREPRQIEKGNPVPVQAVETDYSNFGEGLQQEKFTDDQQQNQEQAPQ